MKQLQYFNQRVLVIGMGLSGKSAAFLLQNNGASVIGVDQRRDLLMSDPEIKMLIERGMEFQNDSTFNNFSSLDFAILSPGIPQSHPLIKAAKQNLVPIFGEMEFGCSLVKNSLLGITGTNGKTTVTMLINHVLKTCGFESICLGNVGVPITQAVGKLKPEEVIILELSSYQLETLQCPVLDTAVILNISPDHLDRYQNFDDYALSKFKIGNCLKTGGSFYIDEKAWAEFGHLSCNKEARLYGYSEKSFIYSDLCSVFRGGLKAFDLPISLQGKKSHELENILAAYALCADKGIESEAFLNAWKIFRKPEHRIEYVTEVSGVHYYDDSKGTNVDAVLRAVESLTSPIILIAGGVDKGSSYTIWAKEFKGKVKSICAIGQAAVKIKEQLSPLIPVIIFKSLDEAVVWASQCSERGDSVLLSPGCASFDMFKDYAHRGDVFQKLVYDIKNSLIESIKD